MPQQARYYFHELTKAAQAAAHARWLEDSEWYQIYLEDECDDGDEREDFPFSQFIEYIVEDTYYYTQSGEVIVEIYTIDDRERNARLVSWVDC